MDPEFVELAQRASVLILVLFKASKLDVLHSGVSPWKENLGKPTNFHDL